MSVAADLRYAFRMLWLSPGFAAVAVITLSGMYAVMGYVTARRTAEFGLRSALSRQTLSAWCSVAQSDKE
jgi:hypothetical protein